MAQYIITYHGGDQPSTPEEGKAHFAKYSAWLADLGSAAVSPMNPFKNTHTVLADGSSSPGSASMMSGYTVLECDAMETALSHAKACPFLDIGGTLEVSEMVEMPG